MERSKWSWWDGPLVAPVAAHAVSLASLSDCKATNTNTSTCAPQTAAPMTRFAAITPRSTARIRNLASPKCGGSGRSRGNKQVDDPRGDTDAYNSYRFDFT